MAREIHSIGSYASKCTGSGCGRSAGTVPGANELHNPSHLRLRTRNSLLWAAVLVAAVCFAGLFTSASHAQDAAPVYWGADPDGGVPYVFAGSDSQIVGFEVDLKAALEKELGRKIEYKFNAFDSLVLGLDRGDISFAMNGLEITPERKELVRFTRPYYVYQLQLVARKGETRFKSIDDCRKAGVTIATLGGSSAHKLLEERKIKFRPYDDQEGPYLDLKKGEVDGVLLDLPIAIYYAVPDASLKHARRIEGLEFVGQPFAEGYYGIAVSKRNAALAEELDAALGRVMESGELKRILIEWELWNHEQYRLYTPKKERAGGDDGATSSGRPAEKATFGKYFPLLVEGAGMTVLITLASMAVAVLIGLPLATARLYGSAPLRWFSATYVEFFRGIPVLLLLYFLYYALPELVGIKLSALQAAILGFGLNYAAYEAEIYRAGIGSIPHGQWEAAASLGMPGAMTFRRIILPQATRVILPPMTNDLVALFKDTSVVSIIAVVELSKQYQMLTKSYGGYVEIGLATAALYLVMSVPLGLLSRTLEKKWGSVG